MDFWLIVEEIFIWLVVYCDINFCVWVEVVEEVNDEGEVVWLFYQIQFNGVLVKNDIIFLFFKYFDSIE